MSRNRRRAFLLRWLSVVAFGSAFTGPWNDSEAWGQLRTGREGEREYYQESPPPRPASRAEIARSASGASRGAPAKLPAAKSAVASRRVAAARDQGVVAASCTSCAQGVAHTHSETSLVEGESIAVDGEYSLENPVDGWSARSVAGCDSCGGSGGDCGCQPIPYLNIRFPFPLLHALSRVSGRIEGATFWGGDPSLPSLVRTAAIGTPNSQDLFGGAAGSEDSVSGVRGDLAWHLRMDACSSIQLRFFDANTLVTSFSADPTSASSVVRPYFDPVGNTQESISIIESGISTGSLRAQSTTDVYGGDLLLRQNLRRSSCDQTEFLIGFQTASVFDSLTIDSNTTSVANGDALSLQDRFDAENRFYGGAVGLSKIYRGPCWSLSGLFKLGFGNMERTVSIAGQQSITVSPPPTTNTENVGVLARSTNIGTYQSETFIVSPELNVTLGYRLTRNWEATLGYTYLGLPKVLRAADQIDPSLAVNLSNPLTGPAVPVYRETESDFDLHSLSYGLQFRY